MRQKKAYFGLAAAVSWPRACGGAGACCSVLVGCSGDGGGTQQGGQCSKPGAGDRPRCLWPLANGTRAPQKLRCTPRQARARGLTAYGRRAGGFKTDGSTGGEHASGPGARQPSQTRRRALLQRGPARWRVRHDAAAVTPPPGAAATSLLQMGQACGQGRQQGGHTTGSMRACPGVVIAPAGRGMPPPPPPEALFPHPCPRPPSRPPC
jgi:hypothetical protein